MFSKPGYFTSRLSPVECSMKAQAAIVSEDQVVGMTTGSLVLIRKLKGNMFQSVLRARLDPDPEGGTAITLTTGVDRIVLVFLLFFLAAFLLICLAWIVAYLRVLQSFQFSDEDRKNYLFLLLPFVCVGLGFGLYYAGRFASKDEGPFLTRLFVEATDAKTKRAALKVAAKPAPKPAETAKEAD
jgi:hypothetical protein